MKPIPQLFGVPSSSSDRDSPPRLLGMMKRPRALLKKNRARTSTDETARSETAFSPCRSNPHLKETSSTSNSSGGGEPELRRRVSWGSRRQPRSTRSLFLFHSKDASRQPPETTSATPPTTDIPSVIQFDTSERTLTTVATFLSDRSFRCTDELWNEEETMPTKRTCTTSSIPKPPNARSTTTTTSASCITKPVHTRSLSAAAALLQTTPPRECKATETTTTGTTTGSPLLSPLVHPPTISRRSATVGVNDDDKLLTKKPSRLGHSQRQLSCHSRSRALSDVDFESLLHQSRGWRYDPNVATTTPTLQLHHNHRRRNRALAACDFERFIFSPAAPRLGGPERE